ncbi:MAG: metallophosphoesterase family protein [Myxococcales bacterium]|nr:metallophosphoesterase family protein [Myxococcales bacterium]
MSAHEKTRAVQPMKTRRGPPFVTSRASVPLRSDGSLTLGLVADTHSSPDPRGLEHLAALKPDVIVHGGDIGDLAVLDTFARIAPVHAVRGNIDVRAFDLPDGLVLSLTHEGRTQLTAFLTHIAVYGPKVRADAAKRARAEKATLLLCGHSHVPFFGHDRGLTVFNPGSIGPRRFTLPILFGVMRVTTAGVTLHHVDCETGQRWEP